MAPIHNYGVMVGLKNDRSADSGCVAGSPRGRVSPVHVDSGGHVVNALKLY